MNISGLPAVPFPPGERADPYLERFHALTTISQALSSSLELDPLLNTVHTEVGRLFDTTNFYIALHREGAAEWTIPYAIERGFRQPPVRMPVGMGLTGHVIRSRSPLLLPDFHERQRELEAQGIFVVGEPPKSWMGVPLLVRDQVIGVMGVFTYETEQAYTESDLGLFLAIAPQVAMAIRIAQLYEDAERRARELKTLVDTGQNISSSLDLETVLERAATDSLALLTGDSLGIFLKEPDGIFKAVATSGVIQVPLMGLLIRPGVGILGSLAASGCAEIVNDACTDPRVLHLPGTPPNEPGEKVMAAPLTLKDAVIGLIAVWRLPDQPLFEQADLDFLQGIGRHISIAIWNARLYGESRRAQAEAESANRAKSSFLANMSHELRTPLNAILLYSNLLRDEASDRGLADMVEDLDRIQGAGRHLSSLIDDVLDLSKIEAGRMDLALEGFLMADFLAELETTIRPLVARNHNRFELILDPDIAEIRSDVKKLRQILLNLLSNAAKFTSDGVIQLRVEQDPSDPEFLLLSVKDSGIGMDQDQMERIFHSFTQADETISRKYGGTGLGLAICRKFVDLLGGRIQVVSARGEGTTFFVSVPAALPARGAVKTVPPGPQETC